MSDDQRPKTGPSNAYGCGGQGRAVVRPDWCPQLVISRVRVMQAVGAPENWRGPLRCPMCGGAVADPISVRDRRKRARVRPVRVATVPRPDAVRQRPACPDLPEHGTALALLPRHAGRAIPARREFSPEPAKGAEAPAAEAVSRISGRRRGHAARARSQQDMEHR